MAQRYRRHGEQEGKLPVNKTPAIAAAFFALSCGSAASALAEDLVINTGGENGAYHGAFCPILKGQLDKAGIPSRCQPSAGTLENIDRVARDPSQLGYGQLDILALESVSGRAGGDVRRLRTDDVRECIFAVTANKEIDSYGQFAVMSDRLRVVLPPERSGSAATFRFLQKIDPYGVGRADNVVNAASVDEAIEMALSDNDSVALFVQFPDPDNARFKQIGKNGGHIVPVLDRTILDQRIDGRPVYFAQETQVENAGWLSSGTKVVTACTPLVVFTGATSDIDGDAARDRHQKVMTVVDRLRGGDLLPAEGIFARMLKRTRELTATGAEKFVEISEQAREKAAPLFEKAREAARQAVEGGHSKSPAPAEQGQTE